MGRKIDLKKIEDVTKCQVTFSKRRSNLMKKANEIAVCCDVDVAFVAFSPSGRVSKFCNQRRVEDVLHRYANLPPERRLNQLSNVQGKMEKLKQLSHIHGETSKLHYLDKQTENLELQIKKRGLELQILETGLRDYEVVAGQEPSLHQLSWCERNLKQSLQRVIVRKMEITQLETQSRNPFPLTSNQNEQVSVTQNPISGQILMQLDPWISPYSAKVRQSIFKDLVDQANQSMNQNIWAPANCLNLPISSNLPNFIPMQESTPPKIESQQPLMIMDQPLLNFHDQNNVNALKQSLIMDQPLLNFQDPNSVDPYNVSSVLFSDAVHMSTQSLCNTKDPRFMTMTNPSATGMLPSLYNEMGAGFQCINSNLVSQFSNMENNTIFSNDNNTRNDINVDQVQRNYQPNDAYNVLPHKEACPNAQYVNLLFEDTHEDNTVWASNQQKSILWEWEDLLRDENFNFQDLPSV